MPVRIVKADHTLSPGVLHNRVHILDIKRLQPLCEAVEVVLLEVYLEILSAKGDLVGPDKLPVSLLGLQRQPAGQRLVGCKAKPPVKVLFAPKSIIT